MNAKVQSIRDDDMGPPKKTVVVTNGVARTFNNLSRRMRLWVESGKRCHWCGIVTVYVDEQVPNQATTDHVIPRGRGGSNDLSNCVSACYACNQRRNDEDQKLPGHKSQAPVIQEKIKLVSQPPVRAKIYGDGGVAHQLQDLKILYEHAMLEKQQMHMTIADLQNRVNQHTALRGRIGYLEGQLKRVESYWETMPVHKFLRLRLLKWLLR